MGQVHGQGWKGNIFLKCKCGLPAGVLCPLHSLNSCFQSLGRNVWGWEGSLGLRRKRRRKRKMVSHVFTYAFIISPVITEYLECTQWCAGLCGVKQSLTQSLLPGFQSLAGEPCEDTYSWTQDCCVIIEVLKSVLGNQRKEGVMILGPEGKTWQRRRRGKVSSCRRSSPMPAVSWEGQAQGDFEKQNSYWNAPRAWNKFRILLAFSDKQRIEKIFRIFSECRGNTYTFPGLEQVPLNLAESNEWLLSFHREANELDSLEGPSQSSELSTQSSVLRTQCLVLRTQFPELGAWFSVLST